MTRIHHIAIRLAFITAPLWLLLGCGTAEQELIIDDRAGVDETMIHDIIGRVNALAPEVVDLDGFTLVILPAFEDIEAFCGPYAVACMHDMRIVISWPQTRDGWTSKQLRASAAYCLAHELGHVYYRQTEGDPDSEHLHAWFRQDLKNSIAGQVFWEYTK